LAQTLSYQLQRVQTAIDKLESGAVSSYEIEGRKITYAELSTLYKREKELIRLIENYGGDYILGANTKPIRRNIRVSFS